jgi:nucleoside-diphosphate-sugar epimerase
MRYCVTGGSGFLGINLVRYLLERGHYVTVLDIADFDYADSCDAIDFIRGDIRNPADCDAAIAGADLVVHCAAALPLYTDEEIFSTDVLGTERVLEACLRHGVPRCVFISSTAVYGVPDHHPLYETDPLIGVGPYGKAKIQAEDVCSRFRKRGLCVPVIRPKSFVGPERLGAFALLYDWARDGRGFPVLGSGDNRYQLLDVEDLCEAVYACAMLEEAAANDVFNIGAEVFTTMREDFQAVLDAAGLGKKIRLLPAGPAIAALRVLELLRLSPLYAWIYATACEDSFVSIEKAQAVLGFRPKYSNQQALVRNFNWYCVNEHSFAGVSGVTHRVPWKQGMLGLAKLAF